MKNLIWIGLLSTVAMARTPIENPCDITCKSIGGMKICIRYHDSADVEVNFGKRFYRLTDSTPQGAGNELFFINETDNVQLTYNFNKHEATFRTEDEDRGLVNEYVTNRCN